MHVRTEDMDLEEMDYLLKKYDVKVFNIHSAQDYPINFDYSKYKIYLENTNFIPTEEELKKYDGLCIDFSHWEAGIRKKSIVYDNFENLIKKYSVGCNHISAIKKTPDYYEDEQGNKLIETYSNHFLNDLSEVSYIKKYPKKYFANYISIELENSFEEQLKVKAYLEKIINK